MAWPAPRPPRQQYTDSAGPSGSVEPNTNPGPLTQQDILDSSDSTGLSGSVEQKTNSGSLVRHDPLEHTAT